MALAPTRFGGPLPPDTKTKIQLMSDREVGLHETIHFAGLNVYDDFVLAAAVAEKTKTKVPDTTGMTYRQAQFAMSNFWNQELKAQGHCPDSLMR